MPVEPFRSVFAESRRSAADGIPERIRSRPSRRRRAAAAVDRRELLVSRRRTADVDAIRRGRRAARSWGRLPATAATSRAAFCYWPDFVPEPERLDQAVLDRFADFLDAHVEVGLGTIPTFIVGHMSGENWDPAWRGDRDLYRDAWLVAQQAWFAGEIAARFGGTRRSSAGSSRTRCLSTAAPARARRSPPGRAPSSTPCMRRARRSRSRSATARGASRSPVSTTATRCGRSRRSSTSSGRTSTRWRTTRRASSSPLPSSVSSHPASTARSCSRSSASRSDFAADEHAADYYRLVLHSTLLAGARGWLAWNNCDYDDLRDQDPYRHHTFEMHFGLTDRAGRPKPQLHEVERFAEFVSGLAVRGWEPVAGDAALVVPEHFERELPFTEPAYQARHPRQPAPGLRRGARGRPPGRARARARRPARKRPPLPRPVHEADDGARARPAARARGVGRDRVPVLFRGQHTEAARPVASVARRDLRCPACCCGTGSSTRSKRTR